MAKGGGLWLRGATFRASPGRLIARRSRRLIPGAPAGERGPDGAVTHAGGRPSHRIARRSLPAAGAHSDERGRRSPISRAAHPGLPPTDTRLRCEAIHRQGGLPPVGASPPSLPKERDDRGRVRPHRPLCPTARAPTAEARSSRPHGEPRRFVCLARRSHRASSSTRRRSPSGPTRVLGIDAKNSRRRTRRCASAGRPHRVDSEGLPEARGAS